MGFVVFAVLFIVGVIVFAEAIMNALAVICMAFFVIGVVVGLFKFLLEEL